MHSIQGREDIEAVLKPGGAMETFEAAKKAGKCRFIGFTGALRSRGARGDAEGVRQVGHGDDAGARGRSRLTELRADRAARGRRAGRRDAGHQDLRQGQPPAIPELGAGFLTGTIDPTTTFGGAAFRAISPRFAADARAANMAMVDLLRRSAERKPATPGQIALAWLLAQKPWIVPIPGTRKLERLDENLGAASVELTDVDLREIDDAASRITVQGARLPEEVLKMRPCMLDLLRRTAPLGRAGRGYPPRRARLDVSLLAVPGGPTARCGRAPRSCRA